MLTEQEATQLKADIGLLIDDLTESPESESSLSSGSSVSDASSLSSGSSGSSTSSASSTSTSSPSSPSSISVTGETIGPGVVNFEELHIHAGNTLTILPGTELVRIDVPPADPAHGDGGIVVHGTLRAIRTPSDPPIVIRSANPAGYRGHLMCHGDMMLDGVEIRDFGRTTIAVIDPVTNPIARYACHWHMAGDRPNSRVENCVIWDSVAQSNHRYGITIHGTNYVTVRNNHVHHKAGEGIWTEDGTEHDNLIEGNLVEDIYGTGLRPDGFIGQEGSGIWLASGLNIVRGNTMRRCSKAGIMYFANWQPIQECTNNTIEDSQVGIEVWQSGGGTSEISNATIRNCSHYGIYTYPNQAIRWKNLDVDGAYIGFYSGDYQQESPIIENCAFRNCVAGLLAGSFITGTPLLVDSCTMSGNQSDVLLETLGSAGSAVNQAPRHVILRNCLLQSAAKIRMTFLQRPNTHILALDRLDVENWQQVAGQNYRVYYAEQDANYIVPEAISELGVGASEPGLTNQQHFAQYGTCIAGEIATCSQQVPGIVGFACPV